MRCIYVLISTLVIYIGLAVWATKPAFDRVSEVLQRSAL